MKKLLLAILLLPALVSAQTYFYIDNITVNPVSPSDLDNISIDLIGNLSNTGSYIVSAMASVNANTVTIDITADSQGGFAVLVPHTETVQVGILNAGQYDIVLNMNFVGDFSPQAEHQFTVTGLGTGIEEFKAPELRLTVKGGIMLITSLSGKAIGDLTIIDLNGRMTLSSQENDIQATLDLRALVTGIYLLQHQWGSYKFMLR